MLGKPAIHCLLHNRLILNPFSLTGPVSHINLKLFTGGALNIVFAGPWQGRPLPPLGAADFWGSAIYSGAY